MVVRTYIFSTAILVAASLVPTHQIVEAVPVMERIVVAAAIAQSPVQTVVKPSQISEKPGTLVKMDFGRDDNEVVTWWLPGGNKTLFDVANDGSTCYFSTAMPGTYYFARIASREDGGKIVQSITEHVVTIEGVPPVKPVDPVVPNPPPVVEPLKPSTKTFGLTAFVTSLIKTNAATLDLKMCPEFSGNWSVIATQIGNHELTTWAAVSARMKDLNSATAAKTVPGWGKTGPVSSGVEKEIARQITAKAFNNEDMAECMKLFSEVSAGYAGAAR